MLEARERIKHLRKDILKKTQEQFALTLNISQSNLGNIEVGRTGITDRLIADICDAYDVSEKWLRTGEGEVFREKSIEDEIVDAFGKLMMDDNSEFVKQFVVALAKLSPTEWRAIEKFARSIVDSRKETKKEEEET